MFVTRCDRCHKIFEEDIPLIIYKYHKEDTTEFHQDICPECLEKYKEFMKQECAE